MRKYSDGGTTDYSHYVTAVAALFNQQGDILILQRGSTAPWMPNVWSLVGGVVDEGENPDEAIVREIMEETGLQVLNLQYKQTKYTKDAGKIVYYAGMLPANFIVRLDYENQDFAFVNLSNIDQYEYVPHVKAYMRNLLEPPTTITKLGRGGKIVAEQNIRDKFKRAGITDKYEIEALNEIDLANTKFDRDSLLKAIDKAYDDLGSNYKDYLISEDSQAITNAIQNDINARYNDGDTDENIRELEKELNNSRTRNDYIRNYKNTQIDTALEWINYLDKSTYPPAFRYLILKALLNYNYDFKTDTIIKRTNKTIRNLTPFDAGTLAQIWDRKSDYLLQDYTLQQIENAEAIAKAKEIAVTSTGGKWLLFKGGSNATKEEIKNNAKELSQLVQDTYWCTKTAAKSQLEGGDFYVYVTKAQGKVFPRIAIRMEGAEVGEVRGNASASQDIEPEMLPIAEEFLVNNIPNNSGKEWLEAVQYNRKAIIIKEKLEVDGLYEGCVEEIIYLKADEYKYQVDYADRNGHIVRLEKLLSKLLSKPNNIYAPKEIIFRIKNFDAEKTRIIYADADFEEINVKNLGNLEIIGGKAYFSQSKVEDLGNLQVILGDADFKDSQVKDLGNLQTIGGDAEFQYSQIKDLGNLQTIGGYAYFAKSQVQNLGGLQTIGGSVNFQNTQVKDLGNLQTIGGDAIIRDSQIKDLGNLRTIGGYASFFSSKIKDLGNLQTIGHGAEFSYSQIQNLGDLQAIGGDASFYRSKIQDLGNLQTIRGTVNFEDSQVRDLGNLRTIGGDAYFSDSQIQNLGNLQMIGGGVNFQNSQVKDLGNLEYFKYYSEYDNSVDIPELFAEEFVNLEQGKYGEGYYRKNMLSNQLAEGGIVKKYGFTEAEIDKWEKENKVSQRKTQNPVVKEAITKMAEGKLTQDEYLKILQKNNPIKPFDRVPPLPTLKEIVGSLKTNQLEKQGIIGYTVEIPDGAYVASRLDIPAYDNYDVWVVSVHDGNKEGNVIGYAKTAYLKNVTFKSSPKTAMRIGMGLNTKSTFARMFGTWVNKSPEVVRNIAVRYMNNPNWIQVGMNPYRHSWFYDKADGLPLVSAEEVIQVGALVLAKNAVKTTVDDPEFIVDKKNPAIKYSDGGKTGSVYYRATSEDMGKQTVFTPVNKYEAFDDEGNPLTRGASDVFVLSDIPEISASKTIGGAILGLWSMFNHNGINPVGKKIYIYEIMDRPRKDLSHVRMADFEYLKEVRYDKPVNGVRSGYFVFDTEFNNNALNFYERLNDDDPYSESQYDEDAWYEFEKYILTLNNNDIVKYADGGKTETLLAPNGKPSNLTHEQWHLVRTPEFKAWFGDWENNPQGASKVVDENGEPAVCYHGAEIVNKKEKGRFNIFNRASYFTDTYKSAEYYAFKLAYGIDDVKEEDTEIYAVFLNIRNPKMFDYKNQDAEEYFHDFYENDKRIIQYETDGYDGLIWQYDYKMYDVSIKNKETHFITFYPTQIKLADGSNTTFDGSNPDIRYADGGEIKSKNDVIVPLYHGTTKEIWKNTEYETYLYVTYDFEFAKSQAEDRANNQNETPIVIKIYPNQIKKYKWDVDDDMGIYKNLITWQDSYNAIGSFVIIGKWDIDDFEIIKIDNTQQGNNPDIRYADGGMTYQQYRDSQFDEQVDRHLPSGYLGEFEIKLNTKSNYPILYLEKDGYEYRLKNKNDSAIGVFHLNKQVGYADNKAIHVAPMYQKKGIGLNLVSILKERNPNHRFGSMTPEGFNLMGKYYDEKIKTNPDIGFAKGGKINIDDYMLVTYHEKVGNWAISKNEIYLWLYDDMDAGNKLQSGEYDYVLFPPRPPIQMAFKKNYVPPLLQVWTKKYQNRHKGSNKLMAIIRAWYDETNHKLYILMMTTRKDLRKRGIISSMIKELRKKFNIEQEDVIFDDPTEEGKAVMESKKFDKGGKTETSRPYSNLDISRVKKGVVQLNSVHPKRITKIDDLPI